MIFANDRKQEPSDPDGKMYRKLSFTPKPQQAANPTPGPCGAYERPKPAPAQEPEYDAQGPSDIPF